MEFAGNPITPSEVLAKLANGEYQDKDVLLGVASNPATPKEILTVLSNGEDARFGLLSNPSTPAHCPAELLEEYSGI